MHDQPTSIRFRARALAIVISVTTLPSAHACWDAAASRYHVDRHLLHAIARTESSLNAHAVNVNRNGTRDIGLMQINSAWLPTLATHGLRERDLYDPCTNLHVGAWILATQIQRLGPTWNAVGAYHSPTRARRLTYVTRVQNHYRASLQPPVQTSLQTTPRGPP